MDVFSDFNATLYQTSLGECDKDDGDENLQVVPRASSEDVRVALKTMAKKKVADERGIVVEMLKKAAHP